MSLNRFGKAALAALVALALGFLSPLARAGDDSVTQQSFKGKNGPEPKQTYNFKVKNTWMPAAKQSVTQQSFKGKGDPTPEPKTGAVNNKSGNVQKTGTVSNNNKPANNVKTTTVLNNNKSGNTQKTGAPSNNRPANAQ
jgi:hypothetical protein